MPTIEITVLNTLGKVLEQMPESSKANLLFYAEGMAAANDICYVKSNK